VVYFQHANANTYKPKTGKNSDSIKPTWYNIRDMNNTEYTITDQESKTVVLRSHDFESIWQKLEDMGSNRGRMSVSATVDDPDADDDGESVRRNGVEVWEDGEEAFA
jgi:uncharacterized protein YigE (DUF2233 family)